MTKSKQRQSLRGAVLIMVLTVMVVLIIMLMATLTVVTTAGQRIYTKFEENQAYYTARSALDVFTANMLSDDSYYAYDSNGSIRTYTYTDESGATPVESAATNMKQGLALQAELYKIKSQGLETAKLAAEKYPSSYEDSSTGEPNSAAYDALDFAENMFDDDDVFGKVDPADPGSDTAPENAFFAVSETALNSYEDDSTTSDDDDKIYEYIEYEITFPMISDGSDSYGKFVDIDRNDIDDDGDETEQVAKIKVEVLDRIYDTSPSYTHEQLLNIIETNDPDDITALKKAIKDGNRAKDKFTLRITSTVQFMDTEGTAVLLIKTNEPPVNNSSRAITAMGTTLGTNHAYVVGGISMVGDTSNPAAIPQWRNAGGVYGAVYNETAMDFNVATDIYLTESECLFIGGDIQTTNDITVVTASNQVLDKDKRPYILSYGALTVSNNLSKIGGTTGDEKEKVDLIVNGINWTGNSFKYNGDIYSYGNCSFSSTAATPDIKGDIYIKGDLTVGGNCVSEDATGAIRVNFGTSCNVYVSGNVIYNGTSYSPSVVDGVNSVDVTDFKALPEKNNLLKKDSKDQSYEIELPGGAKKKIYTHASNYGQYYQKNDNGDYVDADNDGNPDVVTAEKLAKVEFTTASTWSSYDSFDYSTTEIVVASSETKSYVLSGSTAHSVNLEISGGGTVELYLDPTSSNNFAGKILVDDETTLKVYGTSPNVDYNFLNFSVWTQTVYDAATSNTELNVGSAEGHNIKVPKIYYYFPDGSNVNLNGNYMFVGYFMSPGATLYPNTASTNFTNMKYNGAQVNQNWVFAVIGSVLCKDFSFQNDNGVAYINPELDEDSNKEDPILDWKSYQYMRH